MATSENQADSEDPMLPKAKRMCQAKIIHSLDLQGSYTDKPHKLETKVNCIIIM